MPPNLGDLVSSILTPSGLNPRRAQEQQQGQISQYGSNLATVLGPLLQNQASFAAQQEPGRQASITRMLMLASPGNQQARRDLYANQAFSNAARAANNALAENKANGLSGAYAAGNTQAIQNQAQQNVNSFNANMEDPNYQLQQAAGLLSAYNQAQGLPALGSFNDVANIVYKRPAVQVEPNALSQALGPITDAASGLPFFAGGGGDGSGGDTSGNNGWVSNAAGAIGY